VAQCRARNLNFYHLRRRDPVLAQRFAVAVMSRYFGEGEEVRSVDQVLQATTGLPITRDELEASLADQEARLELVGMLEAALAGSRWVKPLQPCSIETRIFRQDFQGPGRGKSGRFIAPCPRVTDSIFVTSVKPACPGPDYAFALHHFGRAPPCFGLMFRRSGPT